jgi:glycosyltransferase involved in cell wall biosynthesis
MGGVESHCQELLPLIAALHAEFDIEVIGRAHYFDNSPASYRGVRITPLRSPRGQATEAFFSTLLGVLYAWRRGADMVHIHAVGPALLAPLARLLGLKVLFTHHGADYNRAKWGGAAKLMLRAGEWAGMRFANRIICVSPSLRERMTVKFRNTAGKTLYIPNGAAKLSAVPEGDGAVLETLGLEPGRFILCVARLVPEKGLHDLVDAHRQSGSDKQLVIAGGEMHGDSYARRLREAAGPEVTFTGPLPRERLAPLYRNAALFVLPSYHEGMPIAALEALSAKCPVLLSDIEPNGDLGLPPNHYFATGNVGQLAALLRSDSVDLRNVPADFADRFDWNAIAESTADVYQSLASQ